MSLTGGLSSKGTVSTLSVRDWPVCSHICQLDRLLVLSSLELVKYAIGRLGLMVIRFARDIPSELSFRSSHRSNQDS